MVVKEKKPQENVDCYEEQTTKHWIILSLKLVLFPDYRFQKWYIKHTEKVTLSGSRSCPSFLDAVNTFWLNSQDNTQGIQDATT